MIGEPFGLAGEGFLYESERVLRIRGDLLDDYYEFIEVGVAPCVEGRFKTVCFYSSKDLSSSGFRCFFTVKVLELLVLVAVDYVD